MLKWHKKSLYHHQLSHSNSLAVTPMETMPAVELLVVVQATLETRKGPLLQGLHNNSLQARLLVKDLALNAVALVHVRRTVSRMGLALRLTDLPKLHPNKLLRK